MSSLKAWLQASRPPALVNIALPLLLGQTIARMFQPKTDWLVFALLFGYGLFMQFFIVFMNDYADADADAINRDYTIFSGGSRVLPEGLLSPFDLRQAGLVAGILALVVCGCIAGIYGRLWLIPMAFCGCGLLWAYSFPPLCLNYRGGGEILQGIGCGIVLPMIGFYAQIGRLYPTNFSIFIVAYFLLQTAGSIATALPDFRADRLAGKRTLPALLGPVKAALICQGLCSLAIYLTYDYGAVFGHFQINFWQTSRDFLLIVTTLVFLISTFLILLLNVSGKFLQFYTAGVLLLSVLYVIRVVYIFMVMV